MVEEYYNGFSNSVLWPLLHQLGIPTPCNIANAKSMASQFNMYKKVNQMFANIVHNHYEEGIVMWCHDYHLMLLPEYLKKLNKNIKVGWFLHTIFPDFGTYSALPAREEILHGVVAADVVGFHINRHVENFANCCSHLIQLERVPKGLRDKEGKFTHVFACPIGIDQHQFIHGLEDPLAQVAFQKLEDAKRNWKLILGIDRLDPFKGIPHKLLSFERFLEQKSDLSKSVKLFQVCVPSRTDVPMYKSLKYTINEITGDIGGKFDRIYQGNPLIVGQNALESFELRAILRHAAVLLITSLNDGMNLVAYEYVASQVDRKGVLIISEFAGAAEFLTGAIKINPNDIEAVSSTIKEALEMPREERDRRHDENFRYVTTNTSEKWAKTFLGRLAESAVQSRCGEKKSIYSPNEIERGDKSIMQRAKELAYYNDNRRLFLRK
ncbi:hypothetical protein KSS87_003008 [Heliosperma pusillum]|nr:hypothetical protein KSS87_003008 [Heliosperma pusillum]